MARQLQPVVQGGLGGPAQHDREAEPRRRPYEREVAGLLRADHHPVGVRGDRGKVRGRGGLHQEGTVPPGPGPGDRGRSTGARFVVGAQAEPQRVGVRCGFRGASHDDRGAVSHGEVPDAYGARARLPGG